MKRKIGTKNFNITIKTENDKNLDVRLNELIRSSFDAMRGRMSAGETANAIDYLLYCSYIAGNSEFLGIEDFDPSYGNDEAPHALGNEYLVKDYLGYFESLKSDKVHLPHLNYRSFTDAMQLEDLQAWFKSFDNSCLALVEKTGYPVARAIRNALVGAAPLYSMRADAAQHRATESMAKLMVGISGASKGSAYDFACGFGTVLSEAIEQGAQTAYGSDIQSGPVEHAKILCFFANPECEAIFDVADMLYEVGKHDGEYDSVFAQPPIGMRLYHSDRMSSALRSNLNDIAIRAFGNHNIMPTTAEEFAIAMALNSLNEEGVAVVQVGLGTLFRKSRGERAFREALVKSGRLRAVIELPRGTQPSTGIAVALVVLDGKAVKDKNLLLVNLDSDAIKDEGYFEQGKYAGMTAFTRKGIDWLKALVSNPREIPMVSTLISKEDFLEHDSSLSFSRYSEMLDVDGILDGIRSSNEISVEIVAEKRALEEIDSRVNYAFVQLDELIEGKKR